MSSVYVTEPPTSGKVILTTSYGEVEIELWCKEAPKACRNFIQLCLEGYFTDITFHRIVAGLCIQTGDASGTGQGGESIYPGGFPDELHSRIKFNHRGQVACAGSAGSPNNSQFFITLDKCPWLDKKHTIFGKVVGSTIFNVLKMGELETDKEDRPLDPPRVIRAEVLTNPFEDIVPRAGVPWATAVARASSSAGDAAKARPPPPKLGAAGLSFGGDDDDEEEDDGARGRGGQARGRGLLLSNVKGMVSVFATVGGSAESAAPAPSRSADAPSSSSSSAPEATAPAVRPRQLEQEEDGEESPCTGPPAAKRPRLQFEEVSAAASSQAAEAEPAPEAGPAASGAATGPAPALSKVSAPDSTLTALQASRQRYLAFRKGGGAAREEATLARLAAFQGKVREAVATTTSSSSSSGAPDADAPTYHGQVLEDSVEPQSGDADGSASWMAASLKFKRHVDDQYRAGGEADGGLVVLDPLERRGGGSGGGGRSHQHHRPHHR